MSAVEYPFGTIKRTLGYTYFLTRGNEYTSAESFMHFLVYKKSNKYNMS